MTEAFFVMLVVFLGREIFFQYQIHQLVNKLMSRNFQDYKVAESISSQPQQPNLFETPLNIEGEDEEIRRLNQLI